MDKFELPWEWSDLILEDYDALREWRGRPLSAHVAVITTNGLFDVLTAGHILFFYLAKRRGLEEAQLLSPAHRAASFTSALLVVGVDADDRWRPPGSEASDGTHLVGKREPVFPLADRLRIVASVTGVDAVVPLVETPPNEFIQAARPHVHVKGRGWRTEDLPEAAVVERLAGRTLIVPDVRDDIAVPSSTAAKRRAARIWREE